MNMKIKLLMIMATKVDEPEGEDEIAGRLEQLRTLITDRFSSTNRQICSTQKKALGGVRYRAPQE